MSDSTLSDKVALAMAKRLLNGALKPYCPTDIPDHIQPDDKVGWAVGEAYVRYLVDDGMGREEASRIISTLSSTEDLDLSVISPEETPSEENPSEESSSEESS